MASAKPSAALSEDQLQLIAKALADPRRYDILRSIGACGGEQACSAIFNKMNISPATLSHHMKELETAGLVRGEKQGKFVCYTLQQKVLRAYLSRLKSDLI